MQPHVPYPSLPMPTQQTYDGASGPAQPQLRVDSQAAGAVRKPLYIEPPDAFNTPDWRYVRSLRVALQGAAARSAGAEAKRKAAQAECDALSARVALAQALVASADDMILGIQGQQKSLEAMSDAEVLGIRGSKESSVKS